MKFQASFEEDTLSYEWNKTKSPEVARIYLETRLLARVLEADDLSSFLGYFLYKLVALDIDYYFYEDDIIISIWKRRFINQKSGFFRNRRTISKKDLLEILPNLIRVFNQI